nr:helitron helicase-like domain at N-terminus [Cressdnaviricota sp.]
MYSDSEEAPNEALNEAYQLKKEIAKLQKKIKYYKSIQMIINDEERYVDIKFTGIRSFHRTIETPFHDLRTGEFEIPKDLYFLTITFDPSRFNDLELITEPSKKDYIIRCLQRLYNRQFLTRLYGCFEYTKKLEIHAHCIVMTGRPSDFRYLLKTKFTDDIDNNVCIDLQPVDSVKNVIRYIEKESFDYFYIGKETALKCKPLINPLDEDLQEKPKELEPPKPIQYLLNEYDKSAKVDRDRFINKITAIYMKKGLDYSSLQVST